MSVFFEIVGLNAVNKPLFQPIAVELTKSNENRSVTFDGLRALYLHDAPGRVADHPRDSLGISIVRQHNKCAEQQLSSCWWLQAGMLTASCCSCHRVTDGKHVLDSSVLDYHEQRPFEEVRFQLRPTPAAPAVAAAAPRDAMQVLMGNRAKKELPAPKQGKLQGDDRCYNALLQLCEEHPPYAGVRWQRQNLPTGHTRGGNAGGQRGLGDGLTELPVLESVTLCICSQCVYVHAVVGAALYIQATGVFSCKHTRRV
jgi:hypothetical protein